MEVSGNAPPVASSAGGDLGEENNPAAVLVDGASSAVSSHPGPDPQPSSAEAAAVDDASRPVTADRPIPEEVGGAMPPEPYLQQPPIDTTGQPIASTILEGEGESAAGSTSADPKDVLRNWVPPPPQAPAFPTQPGPRPPSGLGSEAATSHHPPPLPDVPHIVAPSSYLRQRALNRTAMAAVSEQPPLQPTVFDKEQSQGLRNIREFLKVRTSYDVFPMSFRLIVLDSDLLIKKSLNIMIQNSIVSAPVWDSHESRFTGTLTATDFINVIQYYYQFPEEISKLDHFRLSSLRDIEKAIGAVPIEVVSVHPLTSLYDACSRMLKTRSRRIPLLDEDGETGRSWVVSVVTQYRILKFIAVNNEHNTLLFKRTVRELNLGTYKDIQTTRMSNSVLDVIHQLVEHNISCVPVVDDDHRVLNVFEAVDIIPCIKGGMYEELSGTIGEALYKRPEDSPGIYTCSEHDRLAAIFDTIRKSRVHRLIVVDDDNKLKGVIALSDILKYVLHSPDGDEF